MKSKRRIQIVRAAFILFFAYTGIIKLWRFQEFKQEVSESPVLHPIGGLVIWAVPALELFVVLMLLKDTWKLKGLYSSFVLMILFTVYVVWINNFSFYIPCSCGGWLETMPPGLHIMLNCLLTIIAFAAARLESQKEKSHSSVG